MTTDTTERLATFDDYDGPEPGDDLIDSRNVIEAIATLEAFLDGYDPDATDESDVDYDKDDAFTLLLQLRALTDEADRLSDWSYGLTLVADEYFEDYAKQLAEDVGAIDRELNWPACHIDWSAAARSLRQDYTSVTFGGTEYWVR